MNKLFITGHLVRDAENRTVKVANSDTPVATFTVAANYGNRDANGNRKVQYIRVTAWRQHATSLLPYLKKGTHVLVGGAVSCSVYTSTQDHAPRATMEISRIEDFEFLSAGAQNAPKIKNGETVTTEEAPEDIEEFPFG